MVWIEIDDVPASAICGVVTTLRVVWIEIACYGVCQRPGGVTTLRVVWIEIQRAETAWN